MNKRMKVEKERLVDHNNYQHDIFSVVEIRGRKVAIPNLEWERFGLTYEWFNCDYNELHSHYACDAPSAADHDRALISEYFQKLLDWLMEYHEDGRSGFEIVYDRTMDWIRNHDETRDEVNIAWNIASDCLSEHTKDIADEYAEKAANCRSLFIREAISKAATPLTRTLSLAVEYAYGVEQKQAQRKGGKKE